MKTLRTFLEETYDNGIIQALGFTTGVRRLNKNSELPFEDLINDVEKSASAELYPLLKREDEKFVTEHAYENPKFVEDVLRDVVILLRKNDIIDSFEVECESMESIHNHSAWAYQAE